jgi:PAS domain S-box-containing protein
MGALGAIAGQRANGEEFPIEASISQIEVEGDKIFTVILRDISERQRAEEALRQQAALIDLSPDGIMVRRLDGTIVFWSRGAEALYGWSREEALGKKTHDLLRTEFPVPMQDVIAQLQQTGRWAGELVHRTKDGRQLTMLSFWLARLTEQGEVSEMMESKVDITEQKRTELELRQLKQELEVRVEQRTAELTAANRELEAFTYSVSHDLRAPLRHIMSFTKMLQKCAGNSFDEKAHRHTKVILEAGVRMEHLIDDRLQLSRIGRTFLKETDTDLSQLVNEAKKELAGETRGRAIEWRIGPLPTARCDPSLIRSALINLLSNAIKYTRRKDSARIEIGCETRDSELVVFVRDNGAGFDMRFAPKLFGVFQRLHSPQEFEGTGIGLASVRRVIERHSGRTWAEGEVGQGATFYFTLPRPEMGKTRR